MSRPLLRSLLRQLLHTLRRHPPGRRPGRPRRLPAVECLEDRCLLAPTLVGISLPVATPPPSGTAAGSSLFPSVSADGRYVAARRGCEEVLQT
jgi:hypothetical protein